MARDRTARARIRRFLATSGPLRDPSGYASGALKDAIGYRGSSVAFIQLIAAMERDGEIVREVRGKRTYAIAATEKAIESAGARPPAVDEPGDALAAAGLELDYDALAKALLRQLWSAAKAAAGASATPETARSGSAQDEYKRRLAAARSQLEELLDPARHRSGTASKG